ncbi:MAG TPA: acyltransferase family protein [Virgibacillus sp.]|nr:acyltransferase family protein [Virgibacillus sp.]HLR68684.1 acyltransferase family protein [Virgibacillus sp.]
MEKDLKLSNVKGLLMFLVVFGHFIEIYRDDYYELFTFIYAFHMPLFIFISGYLAKRMKVSKIVNMVLLYLIFQTFFNWVLHLTGDYPNLQFTYGEPHFHLWYIVSLGFWYAIALGINKVKMEATEKWFVFLGIFALSFISRWFTEGVEDFVKTFYDNFSSYTLSFQRTFTFMPFFLLGFFMNKNTLQQAYNSLVSKKLGYVLLLITMFLTFVAAQEAEGFKALFKGATEANNFNEDGPFAMYVIKSVIQYGLAFWLSYLIFNVISVKSTILSKWGDNSLTIFLFHPVFIFIFRQTEFMDDWEPDTKLAFYLLSTVVATYILGHPVFVKYTKYMCRPYNALESAYTKVKELWKAKDMNWKRF